MARDVAVRSPHPETRPTLTGNQFEQRSSGGNGWQATAPENLLSAAANPVSVNSQRITNVATPTTSTDAANKAYVDASAQGLSPKASVRAATTAALAANTYANGTSGVGATLTATANGAFPAVDGVTITSADANPRVLVKNEGTGANNGVFLLTQTGDGTHPWVLTRTSDTNTNTELAGAYVFVEDGTTNNGSGWVLPLDPSAIVVGTTALTWTQFTGAGALTTDGVTILKTGNELSVILDSTATDIQPIGTQAAGSTGKVADAGHVHAHGSQAGGSLHSAATASAAGFQAASDKAQQQAMPQAATATGTTSTATTASLTTPTATNVPTVITLASGQLALVELVTVGHKADNSLCYGSVIKGLFYYDGTSLHQVGNDQDDADAPQLSSFSTQPVAEFAQSGATLGGKITTPDTTTYSWQCWLRAWVMS